MPEISLSQLEGYTEDSQTAHEFEKKGKWRLILVLLLAFGPWGFAWWVKSANLRHMEPYRTLEMILMFGSIPSALAVGLYHTGTLSRTTPVSMKSGLPMERFWRADPPSPITHQMVFVCHTSKTYFRRNFVTTGIHGFTPIR